MRANGAISPSPVALLIASLQVQYLRKRVRRSSSGKLSERRPLAGREKLPREAIGADGAVAALDVDADAHAVGDADDRDASRMRHVEIERRAGARELRPTARAALNLDPCRRNVQRLTEHPAKRPTAGDPSPAQRFAAEPRRACVLGRREQCRHSLDVGGARCQARTTIA